MIIIYSYIFVLSNVTKYLKSLYCGVLKLADIPSCLGGGEKETNVT